MLELYSPPNEIQTHAMEDVPKIPLQEAVDSFAQARALKASNHFLGKHVIVPRDISSRHPGDQVDPTLIENRHFEADVRLTLSALKRHVDKIPNFFEFTDALDAVDREFGLKHHENLLIVMAHLNMADPLAMAAGTLVSSLGEGRSATDNTIFVSEIIPHIEHKMPFSKEKPTGMLETAVLPLANARKTFPETESLAPLWSEYATEMTEINKTTMRPVIESIVRGSGVDRQQIYIMAPTGAKAQSQMHEVIKGSELRTYTEIIMQPIAETTMKVLELFSRNGTPILVVALDFNPIRTYLDKAPAQKMKFHISDPIMPTGSPSKNDRKNPELVYQIKNKLLESARAATEKHARFGTLTPKKAGFLHFTP